MRAFAKNSRPISQDCLSRERLFARLDPVRRGALAWVTGPAGCGKTTLLATWVQARAVPCAWMRLDAADADLATFLEALGQAATGASRPGRLPRFGPAYALGLEAFVHTWFRRFFEDWPAGGVLVLDDCQAIPSSAPLFALLREGLAELPPGAAAVLASRDPPPPSFQGPAATGSLEIVAGDELRLSADEAMAIARSRGVEDPRELQALAERADGWAAGLVLLLAARRGRAPGRGPVPAEATFGYLASEVFDRADDTTRRVLLETSLLPWVDADVVEARLGIAGASTVLAQLARDGTFTVRLDDDGPRYRYHALFRAFLRQRAGQRLPTARLAGLRRAAAALLSETGGEADAVELLRDAAAWPELADLLVRRAPALLRDGRAGSLAAWLGSLPGEVLAASPWLRYFRGLARFGSDPVSSQADFQAALDAFEAARDPTGAYLAWAGLAESITYAMSFDRLDSCLDRLDRLREAHPLPLSPDVAARVAGSVLFSSTWRRPSAPAQLVDWLRRSQPLAATDPWARVMAGIAMAAHDFGLDGHLARARVVLDDVDPSRGGGPDPASLVAWLAADAALRFAAGDGAGTVASAERGLALAASSGARLLDFLLTAELAWGGALDGRLDLADRALASLAVLYQPTLPIQGTWLHQSRCLVALARHDRSRALEEIRAARAASQRSGSELSVVLDLVGEAIVAGPGGEAPPLPGPTLEAALEAARRCGSRWAEHMVLMGLAARERRVGGPRLEARLLEAFAQARQTGYANPVYLLREEVAELCAAALERGIEPDSARAVARVNRLAPPAWARALDGWPWALSVRVLGGLEVEVGGARADALADGGRALELLGVLVALGGSDVDGGRIATELWPDSEGDAARHALETALYRLRKALGDPALVVQAHGLVGLAGGRCWTDLGELQARLTGLERASLAQPGTGGGELTRLAAAVLEAYPGPLLPGLDLPAVCERRGTLDRRVRRIVGLAAAALDRASRPADASMLRAALVARCDPPDP